MTELEFRERLLELLERLAEHDEAALCARVMEYVRRGLAAEGIELSDAGDASLLEPS